MIEILVTSLFALGCFIVVVSLPLQAAGSSLRRVGITLLLIPLAGSFFFGALREAIHQQNVDVGFDTSIVVGLIILSIVAYLILTFRARATKPKGVEKIRQKRVVGPGRRSDDILSKIRAQFSDLDD